MSVIDQSGCKYLIYKCWETSLKGGVIACSLQFNVCSQTEVDAQNIVAELTLRDQMSKSFYDVFVGTTSYRYTYIKNETWFSGPKVIAK